MTTELGDRYNRGKAPLSYLMQFPSAVEGLCRVAEFGASKYSRYNWKQGLDHMELVDSLLRHLSAYADGQDVDEESGFSHLDHVSWNALALAETVQLHPELDSRECATKEES
jgi:hypothetical protein